MLKFKVNKNLRSIFVPQYECDEHLKKELQKVCAAVLFGNFGMTFIKIDNLKCVFRPN